MIKHICDKCGEEIKKKGGYLKLQEQSYVKFEVKVLREMILCMKCTDKVEGAIENAR